MSNVALTWAFKLPIFGAKKSVLIALADHADTDHECNPGQSRLSLYAGVTDRAVRNAIKALEHDGLIKKKRMGKGFCYVLIVGAEAITPEPRSAEKSDNTGTTFLKHRNHVPVIPEPRSKTPEPRSAKPPEPPINPQGTHKRVTAIQPSIPDWIPQRAWNDFVEGRRQMRKPLTAKAIEIQIRKLDQFRSRGVDLEAALDASTANGWQGVFEPREKQNGHKSDGRTSWMNEFRPSAMPQEPDNFFTSTIDGELFQ